MVAVVVAATLWGTTGLCASFAAPLSATTIGVAGMGIGGAVLGLFNWRYVAAAFRMPHARSTVLLGAIALCAGFAYALYTWLLRRLIVPTRLRSQGMHRSMAVSAIQVSAALPLLVFAGITGGAQLGNLSVWPALLYLGLVPMALGHALFARSLVTLSAATATLYTLLEAVVAMILAVAVVGERLSAGGWLGLGAVLVGLVILTLPGTALASMTETLPSQPVRGAHFVGGRSNGIR